MTKNNEAESNIEEQENKKGKKKSATQKLKDQIEELEIQVSESKDKYLRLFAEFDNFKKRNMKERLDILKSASQDTLSALLPVLDDFDRAKKSADDDSSEEQFSEGVTMVYKKIYNIVDGKGLKKMESTGEVFDPELHEAITKIPAPNDDMKGKVIDTIESGYTLNDKIIRHAKVVVGE
ncbi:UNVERIFIED_CONTAM: hypothetical protein GTU68_066450 [Idotea baltica]|nr:hypothetical protein [Idotea baltica]